MQQIGSICIWHAKVLVIFKAWDTSFTKLVNSIYMKFSELFETFNTEWYISFDSVFKKSLKV